MVFSFFFNYVESLAEECNLAATVTRDCVGIWDLQTGRLISKLADSPLGAIVTHACMTHDGKLVAIDINLFFEILYFLFGKICS